MLRSENLRIAKKRKNNNYYTSLEDVEKELKYYTKDDPKINAKNVFRGKSVYCPCDNYEWSAFWKYFYDRFDEIGLKRLVATSYSGDDSPSYKCELYRDEYGSRIIALEKMKGNGDFRSDECIKIMQTCDILCTNPPFTLWKEILSLVVKNNKKFICIGNKNAVTFRETFLLIKENKIWLGVNKCNGIMYFAKEVKGPYKYGISACWFTNFDHFRRHQKLNLMTHYDPEKHKTYDNYYAINADKVNEIPDDYFDVIGVPITFLQKYCPDQFEIIGLSEQNGRGLSEGLWHSDNPRMLKPYINGKPKYARIFVKRKKEKEE